VKGFPVSKLSAVIASAAAASQADSAAAQVAAPVAGTTTFSVEGGVAFSNFSNTAFPQGAVPFIPQTLDKTGLTPQSFGNLEPGQKTGGYGSFSIARNFDALNDWRFSAGFFNFRTGDQSASASQVFTNFENFTATNLASITERDRFGLYTSDFDFGRNFIAGMLRVRAFAGVRTLYTNEQFDATFHTEGTDKTGLFNPVTTTDSLLQGRSTFFGAGPRVGVDTFFGSTFGIVGSASAALLAGYRQSSFSTSTTSSVTSGPIPDAAPLAAAAVGTGLNYLTRNETDWVGHLAGSIGAAWQFSPNGQLVIGYKLEKWWNVRESFNFAGFDKKQDILVQTPFIKATLRF
jgi:hypothetical protein